MFSSLCIHGLRGFAEEQSLRLAVPEADRPGSGLTVIVGSNNAGKSTAIEALRALAQRKGQSFTVGRRNAMAGDSVKLTLSSPNADTATLKSALPGTSESVLEFSGKGKDLCQKIFVLPSRRTFNPHFGKNEIHRDDYMANVGFPPIRSSSVEAFVFRLFAIQKNQAAFNLVLGKVLDPVPQWTIDQMDSGQYFLKVTKGTASHSSEGMGEGIVSLLYIIDALYDSVPGDLIAIDEPELSLHPTLQRRLAALLLEYSATRQIVIATHSPYFTSLDALASGATIARVHVNNDGSVISQLSKETGEGLKGLLRNSNNPHIFGTNAQEIFFVDDKIVLTEGQEDVVYLDRVQESLNERLAGNLFGWGVGSAENMGRVAQVLHELGYQRVVGILDGDRVQLAHDLGDRYKQYHFFAIAANDIRTKKAVDARAEKKGLLDDKNREVREEFRADTVAKFQEANRYLNA